jgi:hypothetical protein
MALSGVLSPSDARDRIGKITSLDWDKEVFTLDNGPGFVAPNKSVELSAFTLGEKVKVKYHRINGERVVTSIRPTP